MLEVRKNNGDVVLGNLTKRCTNSPGKLRKICNDHSEMKWHSDDTLRGDDFIGQGEDFIKSCFGVSWYTQGVRLDLPGRSSVIGKRLLNLLLGLVRFSSGYHIILNYLLFWVWMNLMIESCEQVYNVVSWKWHIIKGCWLSLVQGRIL